MERDQCHPASAEELPGGGTIDASLGYTTAMSGRRALIPLALSLILAGCLQSLAADLDEQAHHIHTFSGRVDVDTWSGAPIVVAVMHTPEREGAPFQIVDFQQLFRPGAFRFVVPEGTYRLVAFVDENRDLDYQHDEPVASHGGFLDIRAEGGGARGDLDIRITGEPPAITPEVAHPTGDIRSIHVGEVLPLTDRRMGPEAARLGVWEPLHYMRDIGAGLTMLEPYRADRVPVVFVHGIGGHPREFEFLISRLDRERFQPWVVRYPSGWQLDMTADFLNRALNEMQTRTHFERMCIVAHSMGGVVSRKTIQIHQTARPSPFIHLFVTIASPLGGHPGAAQGVLMSPAVVPAWRSLVPGSPFMTQLYETPLPEEIRYALFFAYDGRGATDGVVPIRSQLRPEAQAEADLVRGFLGTHTGVLHLPAVSHLLGSELNHCYEGFRPHAEAPTSGG